MNPTISPSASASGLKNAASAARFLAELLEKNMADFATANTGELIRINEAASALFSAWQEIQLGGGTPTMLSARPISRIAANSTENLHDNDATKRLMEKMRS